jgi:hypothetical protein
MPTLDAPEIEKKLEEVVDFLLERTPSTSGTQQKAPHLSPTILEQLHRLLPAGMCPPGCKCASGRLYESIFDYYSNFDHCLEYFYLRLSQKNGGDVEVPTKTQLMDAASTDYWRARYENHEEEAIRDNWEDDDSPPLPPCILSKIENEVDKNIRFMVASKNKRLSYELCPDHKTFAAIREEKCDDIDDKDYQYMDGNGTGMFGSAFQVCEEEERQLYETVRDLRLDTRVYPYELSDISHGRIWELYMASLQQPSKGNHNCCVNKETVILQVVALQELTAEKIAKTEGKIKYECLLSDGSLYCLCLLGGQYNPLVEKNILKVKSILKTSKFLLYSKGSESEKCILWPLDHVCVMGSSKEVLGSPVSISQNHMSVEYNGIKKQLF